MRDSALRFLRSRIRLGGWVGSVCHVPTAPHTPRDRARAQSRKKRIFQRRNENYIQYLAMAPRRHVQREETASTNCGQVLWRAVAEVASVCFSLLRSALICIADQPEPVPALPCTRHEVTHCWLLPDRQQHGCIENRHTGARCEAYCFTQSMSKSIAHCT